MVISEGAFKFLLGLAYFWFLGGCITILRYAIPEVIAILRPKKEESER